LGDIEAMRDCGCMPCQTVCRM